MSTNVSTFGRVLIEQILPAEYHGKWPLTKKALHEILTDIAKKHPDQYPRIVTELKKLGDEFATSEGISVGLDDVAPSYETRDAVLDPFKKRYDTAKTTSEKEKILVEAQDKILDYTKNHPGTMAMMARSGGRGNMAQLMKIVSSPVLATNDKDKVIPWMIGRSYSEGLKPAELWATGSEARVNAIKSNLSVTEPGDLSKILINNMSDKLVTESDCKTKNGIQMNAHDPHVVDRYLAHDAGVFRAGTLITPRVAQELSKLTTIVVRSPMTCESHTGVCQKCFGLDSYGAHPGIGVNVGLRAAQSLAEPLTQLALNAKHGGRINTKDLDTPSGPTGITGLRQFIEVPASFMHKATLAEHDGTVDRVEKAPQGGQYVWLGDTKHYVSPDLSVKVKTGDKVYAGDPLSNGIPKPSEIVKHKGLGVGRKYMVDSLHDLYSKAGNDIDKRHLETLAKSLLNYVYVTDTGNANDSEFMKGDVVNYNKYSAALKDMQKQMPLPDAHGELLADNILHYTAGTRITPEVVDALTKRGMKTVPVAAGGPRVEFMMKPATRNPLLNPDWMARLGHRFLKDSLIAGAHRADISDLHGALPIPAYVAGTEFGQGPDGKY